MTVAKFKIDGQQLQLPLDHFNKDEFTVRSVPRPYRVHWETAAPAKLLQALMDENPGNLLLIDENVHALHGRSLDVPRDRMVIARASEEYKSLSKGVLPLVDLMANKGITKSDKLIVVGGGIVQDVGVFAACIYKRGIPCVLFPTTLLSMCDSCIGGKTGINHNDAKNQLALFSAPSEVVICPEFLNTLPNREIRGGLGEILKLHVTGGPTMLARYVDLDPVKDPKGPSGEVMKALLWGSLGVKKAVIEEDEFELNLRKSMNYGHTIGHAVEALSDYAIPHGHAVTIGMLIVNELAHGRKLLSAADKNILDRLCFELLTEESLAQMKKLPPGDLTGLLRKDKKTTGSQANFVLVASVGDMRFVKIENDDALAREVQGIIRELFAGR